MFYVILKHKKRKFYIYVPDQEKEKSHFQDKDSGVELEHVEELPLLEWYANNYKNFGNDCTSQNRFFLHL